MNRTRLVDYLATDTTFRRIYDHTRERFNAAANLTAHNFAHSERDVLNAITIGEAEGANMHIVLCAAIMHDIGFLYGATGKTHGAVGADRLSDFLNDGTIELPVDQIEAIRACIRTHKGSMHGEGPESLEAKVVSDADMLEKLGPVGVYQAIRTFTEFNYNADRIVHNLSVMADWQLQTPTGRRLAEELKPFNQTFSAALAQAYEPYRDPEAKVK